jgi:predicted nucleic acid-binding Zn ribbon protein
MSDRHGPPRALGNLLNQLLKAWGLDRLSREREVFTRWSEALGEPLARNIRPVAVHHGVLVIAVKDSVWLQELQFMKADMKKKLNRTLGRGVITDLRFKVGAWDDAPAGAPAAAAQDSRPRVELDSATVALAEDVTRVIKDPILRDQVKRTLLATARRPPDEP